MKRNFYACGWVWAMLLVLSAATLDIAAANAEEPVGGFVKIVNDTKQDIRIYTGSGHVMLYHKGGSTSVSCDDGKKIYTSDGSKKGALIFTIEKSMCGKTVKLSAYL